MRLATSLHHATPPLALPSALARCSVLLAAGWNGDFAPEWTQRGFRQLRWPDDVPPRLDTWARGIAESAAELRQPVVVVAQGFAALAVLRASALRPGAIAGALLLAPADPARYGLEQRLADAAPGFPTVLLPGEGPDALAADAAWIWALRWDSQFASLGGRDGALAPLNLLEQLCRRVADS